MDIISGYDSDEEFQFSPSNLLLLEVITVVSEDWKSSEPLLAVSALRKRHL